MAALDGKIAIVTGGARGMGAAHARRLVADGAQVVIGDILDDQGKLLADELGEQAVFVHLDVTSTLSWAGAVAQANAAFGLVNVLVNNAAVMALGTVDVASVADFTNQLEVNLTGPFLGIQAVVPDMKGAGGGSIVNISSAAGLVGMAALAGYSASKWGVRGLTKCAALDLGRFGIRVNSLHPGGIRSPMTAMTDGETDAMFASQAMPRMGEVEEMAAAVAFLAGNDSSYITGAEIAVDGGMVLGALVPAE